MGGLLMVSPKTRERTSFSGSIFTLPSIGFTLTRHVLSHSSPFDEISPVNRKEEEGVQKMKVGRFGLLALTVLLLNWSTSSAWFGDKQKRERKSSPPGEAASLWVLNRAGSSILFPVHGNVYPVGFYNVTLSIGHPPRSYFLDVDTGSDLTWLQCDAPCSHCSEVMLNSSSLCPYENSKYKVLIFNFPNEMENIIFVDTYILFATSPVFVTCFQTPHPLYQPSNDLVPCKDPLCASLQPSDDYNCEHPDQCDYEIEYADHYSSLGVLVKDVFILNFTNGIQLKVRMALGCGYDQIFPASYHPLDGILGLGRGKSSLISQLNGQGLVRNVVGHCLSGQGGGYIFFGNVYDSSRVIWTPMSSKDTKHYTAGAAELVFGGQATGVVTPVTFDTGSSYTYFNSKTYQALISWLKEELTRKPLKEAPEDQSVPLCWHCKRPFKSIREARKYFKPLALSFTSGGKVKTQFEIPPEAYLIISNKGNVCLGILDGSEAGMGDLNLIGDISMQDKVMVFDNEKQLIGWAPANCDRVPKFRDVSI